MDKWYISFHYCRRAFTGAKSHPPAPAPVQATGGKKGEYCKERNRGTLGSGEVERALPSVTSLHPLGLIKTIVKLLYGT